MAKNEKGKLIVIDGIDGSGKATQTKILIKNLRQAGFKAETIDFPQYQNNFFGNLVRQYLDGKFGDATKVDPHLASILYAADRWESKEKIQNWLKTGKIVVLDRYYTSNLIHQSAKLPDDKINDFISWIQKLEFEIFKIPQPDLVIYLHLDPKIALQFISSRGRGYDGHDRLAHLKKAESRCLYLAKKLGWQTVEGAADNKPKSINEIAEETWTVVKNSLS